MLSCMHVHLRVHCFVRVCVCVFVLFVPLLAQFDRNRWPIVALFVGLFVACLCVCMLVSFVAGLVDHLSICVLAGLLVCLSGWLIG